VRGGGLQALPLAWSAISKVQSALRADTERIRADTDRIQMSDNGERRCVEEDSRRSHWLGAQSQKFRAHSERIIQSGYRAEVRGGGLQALPLAWSAISKVLPYSTVPAAAAAAFLHKS